MKILYKNGVGEIGRNSDCPCGSGKKFKYCCIDTAGVPLLQCIQPKNIMKRHRWMLKAIRRKHLSILNRCAKRYNAKMKRRNK